MLCASSADLVGVQVVRRRDRVDAELEIGIGGKLIGNVQAEIADQRMLVTSLAALRAARRNGRRIAQSRRSRKLTIALFLRFEHARAGDARRDARRSDLARRPDAGRTSQDNRA